MKNEERKMKNGRGFSGSKRDFTETAKPKGFATIIFRSSF